MSEEIEKLKQRIAELEGQEARHKKTVEMLLESEHKYRVMVEQSQEGIAIAQGPEPRILLANQALARALGYSLDELKALSREQLKQLLSPEDRDAFLQRFQDRLAGKPVPPHYELRACRKDGSTVWFDVSLTPIQYEGRPAILARLTDMAERQQIQACLQDSEANCRELADSITDVFFAMDRDLKYTYWNKASEQLTGIKAQDALGRSLYEVFPEVAGTEADKAYQEVLSTKQGRQFVNEYDLRDRHYIFEISVYPSRDGISVFTKDITGRKTAEQEIIVAKERLQHLLSNANAVIYTSKTGGDYGATFVSDSCTNITGHEAREFVGQSSFWLDHVHPDDVERILSEAPLVLENGNHTYEYRFRHKNGTYIWVRDEMRLVRDGSGQPLEIVGYWLDITARKNMERAVAESQEKYRNLVDHALVGIYKANLDGEILFANNAMASMFEYPSPDALVTRNIRELYDRKDERTPLVGDLMQKGHLNVTEIDMVTRTGNPVSVLVTALLEGDVISGMMMDVTERKRAAEQLKRNFEVLQHTMEGTIYAMARVVETRDPFTAGHQRRVANLATAIGHAMGLSADDTTGLRMAALIHDIGKIYVPAEILSRPSKLTEPEFALIKTHPGVGYDILKTIEFPWPVADIVLQHHERLNGSGYPHGLRLDAISITAQILCVADVVEAMSSHRPYRPARGIDVTLDEISKNKGVLYDPAAVDCCVRLLRDKEFSFD